MLYQKYRPDTVDSIDNTQVRHKITNFMKSAKIPHSWIFTGGRGMGKTSVARILATEVNKTGDESLDAKLRLEIAQGSNPDIVEINGADTTGIDAVRELIERAQFSPLTCKYRVYIIDEVHMLSTAAFNGLLKILEEPPAHAIFVLATTDFHKIPPTIASRCVRVDFGLASQDDLKSMIARVARGESIALPDAVADLVARKSDKSFREATKLLEELIAQGALDAESASAYLQNRDTHELLPILCHGKSSDAIVFLDEFTRQGGDLKHLIEDTLTKLHAILLRAHGVTPDTHIPDKCDFSITQCAKLMKLFSEAYSNCRNSYLPQIAIQIAIVEYYQFQAVKKA